MARLCLEVFNNIAPTNMRPNSKYAGKGPSNSLCNSKEIYTRVLHSFIEIYDDFQTEHIH